DTFSNKCRIFYYTYIIGLFTKDLTLFLKFLYIFYFYGFEQNIVAKKSPWHMIWISKYFLLNSL
ncbi:MAG TPA: hypothetical protein DIV56_04545, partial [Lachnospiraceae bacterium]|nr:hypothetical protein [Lachnospiraceae bacterium]